MPANASVKPKILCVDDEVRVTEGLAMLLRREFDVHIATSGEQALQKLREVRGLAVVISDMRMPNMDGARFLQEMVKRCPDATRILLTGHAELEAAKRAVNEGQIFRFLTKPCPPDELRAAIEAGVAQNRLVTAERAVLRETLIGCIRALTDVLAMSSPVAFGRASAIKRLAMHLAAKMGFPEFWQLEAAALLSQVGYLSLHPEVAEKMYYGKELTPQEGIQAAAAGDVAKKLVEHIPRLEPVAHILASLNATDEQLAALGAGPVGVGARVLGLAVEACRISGREKSAQAVVQALRPRAGRYGVELIDHLGASLLSLRGEEAAKEVALRQVAPGMIILQDVRNPMGVMLVPVGFEVTQSFLDRLSNFSAEFLEQRVRVAMPPPTSATPA